MNYFIFILSFFLLCSCNMNTQISKLETVIPINNFIDKNKIDLNYENINNWAFRSDINNYQSLLPKNYDIKNDSLFNISVFYIHPTTLFNSTNWNADTAHFSNSLINMCLENQASVFAGLTSLYAPHYREMHIHSYNDTVNGYKAYDFAFSDIKSSFNYFINKIGNSKFILASHSQGTNHAKRLINEVISKDSTLSDRFFLGYLLGMDIAVNELSFDFCKCSTDIKCIISWRTFNNEYYPKNWNYGSKYLSFNPITNNIDTLWSNRSKHLGILFPNKKILFKNSLSAKNEKGLLWVKFPNNLILNFYKTDSYHRADYNLFWLNIRKNLILRLNYNKTNI